MDTNVIQVKLISSAKDWVSNFIPIIGVLVGGILTFGTGYILYLFNARKEKKKLLREKLEELYVLTCKTTDWAAYEYAEIVCAVAKTKPDSPKVTDPFNGQLMLARLYHPRFFEDVSKIKHLGSELQKSCISLLVESANFNNPTDNSVWVSKITVCLNELQKANDILQAKISNAMKGLV